MSILLGLEPSQKLGVGGAWVGGGWSKGILEFRFAPNLGLGPSSLDQAEQKYETDFLKKKKIVIYGIKYENGKKSLKINFVLEMSQQNFN